MHFLEADARVNSEIVEGRAAGFESNTPTLPE